MKSRKIDELGAGKSDGKAEKHSTDPYLEDPVGYLQEIEYFLHAFETNAMTMEEFLAAFEGSRVEELSIGCALKNPELMLRYIRMTLKISTYKRESEEALNRLRDFVRIGSEVALGESRKAGEKKDGDGTKFLLGDVA